ncbi:MAG: class I SAM-dependent methyltransferase [Acidobacteriota bacterium]|nr:class I SAM-dependent methyltransferase [Acidobacteriota bacterium]
MYDTYWADWYLPAALPALENLFFSAVQAGTAVLDVCCGSGHITQELVRRGYRVAGVDSSSALIDIARRRLPEVEFSVQDVRSLRMHRSFEAALSTFDSLNHILDLDGLRAAFAAIHRVLLPGGLFVFDMNLEDAYLSDLSQWHAHVHDDNVGLVRGTYDAAQKKASTELIWFVQSTNGNGWQRRHSIVEQRCYKQGEILSALADAGFSAIGAIPAMQAGATPELGFGRMFFSATASEEILPKKLCA